MVKDNVTKILSEDFNTVKGHENLAFLLIKTYSILYKDGKQVRTCENSMLKYYNVLKKSGKMKAKLLDEIKKRTCEPNWKGIKEIYFSTGISDRKSVV